MKSLYFIAQVVLVVVLATLFAHHLQLRKKYEELKISCEKSILGNGDGDLKVVNVNLKQMSKAGTKGSFVMQSSSEEENERTRATENDGYIEENEPTHDYKAKKEDDLTVTFSSVDFNEEMVGGVLQTSNSEVRLSETKAAQYKKHVFTDEIMASTNDGDINIQPSNSLQVQITEKSVHADEPSRQAIKKNSTQDSIYQIDPSLTDAQGPSQSPEKENTLEIHEKFRNVDESNDEIPTETENDKSVSDQELLSSDTTDEKGIFVDKTTGDNIVQEVTNDHSYLEIQDSTPILNTEHLEDSFQIMTEIPGYIDNDMENCDLYDCEQDDETNEEDDDNDADDRKENGKHLSFINMIMESDKEDLFQLMTQGTSAWCDRENQTTCRFRNLCYNTRENDFVFIKGENNIVDIGKSKREDDIFDINLSTIQGHNTKMFSVVTLPSNVMDQFSIGMVRKRAIAFSRFKPDNIMHVLHDDVLPLFDTLDWLRFAYQDGAFDAAIMFTDSYEDGSYIDFYSSFSTFTPISPWKVNQTYDLLCFPDIHVGLRSSTVWYQYGFFKPQGPISLLQENVLENIHKAADYLSVHFSSECFLCSKGNYLVFLSRKDNRLILNEGELIMLLMKATKLKIMSVSLETHSLSEIVTTIRQSRGIFGMHGSLLSLAVFLPPGSILIELFPFGVDPSKYTPFKTFCDLPGSRLIYKSWTNPSREKSIPHPDRLAREGGIAHLPKHKQDEIVSQTEVPEHLCCDDPSWLYHIYQDTLVDVDAIVSLAVKAINESKNDQKSSSKLNHSNHISIPGSVKNLVCENVGKGDAKSKHESFVVGWEAPWMFGYDAMSKDYTYELVLQDKNSGDTFSRLILPSDVLSYEFEKKAKRETVYNVWVRVVAGNGEKSQNKFTTCGN